MARLLIDGGQTGTRLRVVDDGQVLADVEAGGVHTDAPVVPQIATLATQVLDGTSTSTASVAVESVSVESVSVGLSGLTPEAARPDELLDALTDRGVTQVALAHDSITAYLAANGRHRGAVTAVGTGVVTLGVGATSTARVDGWGHLVGDAGSGYWIGRAGIDAALRAFDGRGRTTALEEVARAAFGPLPELYMSLQGDPARVSRIAGFAKTVAAVADDGDLVAAQINRSAAEELAISVHAALVRCGWTPGDAGRWRVSWMGAVLKHNRPIRDHFTESVVRTAPGVIVEPPAGEPLDGVGLLLDVPPADPLYREIRRAPS